MALHRPAWCSKVNKGTIPCEQNRIAGGSEEAWAAQIQSNLLDTCSRNLPVSGMRQSLLRPNWIDQPQLETQHLIPLQRDILGHNRLWRTNNVTLINWYIVFGNIRAVLALPQDSNRSNLEYKSLSYSPSSSISPLYKECIVLSLL